MPKFKTYSSISTETIAPFQESSKFLLTSYSKIPTLSQNRVYFIHEFYNTRILQ